MENHIQINLDKIFIPLINFSTCVLDLVYNNKKYRFSYPLKSPIDLYLSSKFQNDTQVITLTVMIIMGNKYKKIARGDIHLYKKYFLGDKSVIEKWIYLTLFQTQLENMGHNTDIIKAELNKGKIYMTMTIVDPVEMKKNILIKDPITSNKTERFRSIVENSNAFLKKIKQKKSDEILEDLYEDLDEYARMGEFCDGLSDISISIVDLNEEGREGIDINELANDEYIKHLSELIKQDYENILPNDPKALQELDEELYKKYQELSVKYNETLNALNKEAEEMRLKAKDYYEKYKAIKADIYKRRKALKENKKALKDEIANNSEMNKKILEGVDNYKKEVDYLDKAVSAKEKDDTTSEMPEDLAPFGKIIEALVNSGINIFECTQLSDKEKEKLKKISPVFNEIIPEPKKEEENVEEPSGNSVEDPELGNKIIQLIENDVNQLFNQKKITSVKIDQIDDTKYSFENEDGIKEIVLKIEKDALLTTSGEKFSKWLQRNFHC